MQTEQSWNTSEDFHLMIFPADLFQGEGVAYRGRILVELSTLLDGKVDKNVDDISSDDILVAQVQVVWLMFLSPTFLFFVGRKSLQRPPCPLYFM